MIDNVGEIVKARREELQLTQHDLAELADVSRAWISQLELGNLKTPSMMRMASVASVLGIDITSIIRQEQPTILVGAHVTEARKTAANLLTTLSQLDPATQRDALVLLTETAAMLRRQAKEHAGVDLEIEDVAAIMVDVARVISERKPTFSLGAALTASDEQLVESIVERLSRQPD